MRPVDSGDRSSNASGSDAAAARRAAAEAAAVRAKAEAEAAERRRAQQRATQQTSEFSTGRGRALRNFSQTGAMPAAAPVRPPVDPPAPAIDKGVTDALADLKAAQKAQKEAAGTSFSRVEHSDAEVSAARDRLETAIGASGPLDENVNDRFAGLTDPADRLRVAEAAADLAKKRADATAKKWGFENDPNLEGRRPDAEHIGDRDRSRVSEQSAQETSAARELEAKLQDKLIGVADGSVTQLRASGLTREQALDQLKTSAGPTAAAGLGEKSGVPNTLGMTHDEKVALYEKRFMDTASPEAKAAYARGEKVVLALRHDTPLFENGGRGEFDDRFVVLQQNKDGSKLAAEYRACLDPNLMYGNGMREEYQVDHPHDVGQYAERKDASWPWQDDKVDAYGRIASGQTVRFQTGPDDGKLYPKKGEYKTQADLNGDGIWNDDATYTEDNNNYQLHGSAVAHTGSGGCITVPAYQAREFKDLLTSGQPTVSEKQGRWPWSGSKDESTVYITFT